jgi:DUF4097 and DUF4098 domain-containing protein YvlB
MNRTGARLKPTALIILLLVLGHRAIAVEVLEDVVEQRHSLAPDGTLSIQNIDGSIQIYGGAASEISIKAIKKAYSLERLKEIKVEIRATPTTVAIKTIFAPKKGTLNLSDRSGTVKYILTVPENIQITKLDLINGEILVESLQGGSAHARLINGLMTAHNCFGDLDFSIVNGRLEAVYDWWNKRKFLVKLSSGNIRAIVPSDASASITARTVAGGIVTAFDKTKEIKHDVGQSLDFTTEPLPEASFKLDSVNGNIRIDKAY